MADNCKGLPTTIDIGGEIIYLDGTSANINFAYKGREYFKKTFMPKPGDECILRKYMYHSLESKQPLDFKNPSDKRRLNEILTARKKTLWDSIQQPSNTVIKNNLVRYYRGITTFLNQISGITPPPDTAPYEQCENERGVLDEIKEREDRIAEMLLQVTWYLMNPDEVPSEIQCDWLKMVQKMKEHTTFADVKSALALPNSKSKALNYFKRIDLKEFGKEQNHKKAIEKAKTMMAVEPSEDVMKNRLKQIMTLLSLKNYVKGSLNNPSEANIAAITNTLPSKLVDIGLPLQEAFLPMKSFLKSMYDPVYTLLEGRTEKTESLMAILLILLHICNTIPKSEKMYGVYRINNVPPEGLKWVRSQLYNPNEIPEKQDDHAKQMYHLSKLSLPIFTDTAGELQAPGSSINKTPYFQFGIMGKKGEAGTNLSIADNPEQNVGEIKKFFPENTLFLFVSKSEGFVSFKSAHTGIPATFYSIDYKTVDPKATTLTVTPDTTSIKEGTTLDKLITIDPNLACNHSNLVLSIFYLLDARLASKKPDETATAPKASKTATTAPKASSNATVPTTATAPIADTPPATALVKSHTEPLSSKTGYHPAEDATVHDMKQFQKVPKKKAPEKKAPEKNAP